MLKQYLSKFSIYLANLITEKDFDLANKIEEVIMWQPGIDNESALEGTPDDQRFKYLKYD